MPLGMFIRPARAAALSTSAHPPPLKLLHQYEARSPHTEAHAPPCSSSNSSSSSSEKLETHLFDQTLVETIVELYHAYLPRAVRIVLIHDAIIFHVASWIVRF
jgi:hypothetical protein